MTYNILTVSAGDLAMVESPPGNFSGVRIKYPDALTESPWATAFPSSASFCAYCGGEWYPDAFHPGCCAECGGPRREVETQQAYGSYRGRLIYEPHEWAELQEKYSAGCGPIGLVQWRI